jgi:hypothetical protein
MELPLGLNVDVDEDDSKTPQEASNRRTSFF